MRRPRPLCPWGLDPFHSNNRYLSDVLWGKGIWHAFRIWSGRAHNFRHWQEMARIFM